MRLANIRLAFALLAVTVIVLPAYAQRDIPQPKGTWQQPKEFQVPKGKWQEPGNIQIPKGINAVKTTVRKAAKSRYASTVCACRSIAYRAGSAGSRPGRRSGPYSTMGYPAAESMPQPISGSVNIRA